MIVKRRSQESSMQTLIYQWIDLLWVPIGLIASHRGQRIKTTIFVLTCVFTLRTQLELMDSIGHPDGFLGLWSLGLYERGLIFYGLLNMIFLILVHLSPSTKGVIFLAAMISLYILGFCVSMLAMVL
jgi:hypothetical protein